MSYVTKNYMQSDKWVVGGTLKIEDGATVTGITTATIVDNLTSTDTDKALSAKQGKELKTLVDAKIATSAIVNDLTTGGVAVPLSAEQGKSLATTVNGKLTATIAAVQADSVATSIEGLVADFNALLAKLKTAGLMANE